jgi:hypothetical protein
MIIDTEERGTGKRRVMEEMAVYTVAKGKVIREEFMYGPVRIISEGSAAAESSDEEIESREPELVEA